MFSEVVREKKGSISYYYKCMSISLVMLIHLSSRNPEYYEIVDEPIDLTQIERHILTGKYKTVDAFDADFLRLFRNVEVKEKFECSCVG